MVVNVGWCCGRVGFVSSAERACARWRSGLDGVGDDFEVLIEGEATEAFFDELSMALSPLPDYAAMDGDRPC